jgi:hypothetical protein
LIAHDEQMDQEEQVADVEAVHEAAGQTVRVVPTSLVPAIGELMAREIKA